MATGRLPDPNTAPLTAKGDLYTYSTVPARLAVGNDGETLVADSSATTGLRWQGNYSAGKNKIINGDFTINQRAFSSTTSALVYMFDRFFSNYASGTSTYSAQTFTPGTAPVAGYEARNFLRCVTTGQTGAGGYAQVVHRIEDVRTLAGQTATISFWAKAGSGTPKIGIELAQEFGSGGSPSSDVTNIGSQSVTISTSWTRYSLTVSVPSISGKTIGTTANTSSLRLNLWLSAGTDFATRAGTPGLQNATFDIWGVQVEAGDVATAFQTATGTLAGELAACLRYYERSYGQGVATGTNTQKDALRGSGSAAAGTTGYLNCNINFTVEKRSAPTITIYDVGGTSGVVSRGSSGASPVNNQNGGTYEIGTRTAGAESSGTSSQQFMVFHYTASSEL